jgi:hypothetical protein
MAIIVIVGGIVTTGLLAVSLPLILKRSGACAYTLFFDHKFGDQHLKTTVALLELYNTRHGHYPGRLSDLDFVGDWDRIALNSVAYYANDTQTHYYLEVTRGWLCSPSLQYPDDFWNGTGYDPSVKP